MCKDIATYEAKISELVTESRADKQKIAKCKDKINTLKQRASSREAQQPRGGFSNREAMISRVSNREFISSETPETEYTAAACG